MSYETKELVNKLGKLGDRLHLNREQAQKQLETTVLPKILAADEATNKNSMLIIIDVLKLMFSSSSWEHRFGAITGSCLLAKHFYEPGTEDPDLKYFFWNFVRGEQVHKLLVDSEFRVRNQLGELLKEMIKADLQKGV